jgi:hypothetical protein
MNMDATNQANQVQADSQNSLQEMPQKADSASASLKKNEAGLKELTPNNCDFNCASCELNDRCFWPQETLDNLPLERLSNDPEMQKMKAFFQALQSLSCEDLYEWYCDKCDEEGDEPINERAFGKLIKRNFPHIKRVRIRRNGILTYIYKGATFKKDPEAFHRLFEKKQAELGLI